MNLRLSHATFEAIDRLCAARPDITSRNKWVTEAVAEKIAKEDGR